MSKKYLSLEEAAAKVGIDKAELNRMREKGLIRAFADRGNWKFKEEDVENLARNRQFDSDPDLSLTADSDDDSRVELATGDSSGDLIFSDDDILGQQPTIITKGKPAEDDSSDSDVRLIFDDAPSSGNFKRTEDSDSDVKLAGAGSSGDISTGSDSDVRLVTDEPPRRKTGSDSDVRLVSSESSSEIKIPRMGSSDDLPSVSGGSSSSVLDDDDGISLAGDSAAPLGGDSGISLERPNDSGISLSDESSIIISGDSGISLALDDDEGISLADVAPVKSKPRAKGPAAAAPPKAGKSKGLSDDDLTGTIPLLENEDLLETDDAMPLLDPSSGDIEAGSGTETSVITLDDDEDEYTASGASQSAMDDVIAADDDEEVVEDLIGEDDEIAEDVFGAEDDDFDDGMTTGESSAEFATPKIAAAVEQDWGTGTLVGLGLSTAAMVVCGILMFDMLRNLWHTDVNTRNPMASALLDIFK